MKLICGWYLIVMSLSAADGLGREPVPRPVASPVADFQLEDLDGGVTRFSARQGRVTVIAFVSARCPMSNAFNSRLNELYTEFSDRVRFIVINSNANETREEVRRHAQNVGYDFPVYKDVSNAAADLLGAKATPYSFVLDQKGIIKYRGYIEDAPNPERSKIHALRDALDAVLRGQQVPLPETHSLGCAIRRANPELP